MSSSVEVFPEKTVIRVCPVPVRTLNILAEELRKYGCVVVFETPFKGTVKHISGEISFNHDSYASIIVTLDVNASHFPHTLLVGGIRQMIEETAEDLVSNEKVTAQ